MPRDLRNVANVKIQGHDIRVTCHSGLLIVWIKGTFGDGPVFRIPSGCAVTARFLINISVIRSRQGKGGNLKRQTYEKVIFSNR